MSNKNLHVAKETQNDEFYTQYSDIELECTHYISEFEDKAVYCNCDNLYKSNFFKYFANNFKRFKLKQLACSCFDMDSIVKGTILFLIEEPVTTNAHSVVIKDIVDMNKDGQCDYSDVLLMIDEIKRNPDSSLKDIISYQNLESDYEYQAGDFRSDECVELLKQSDIVVTNPPFSLFRDFIVILEKYHKKYLAIGSTSAVTYKDVFPYFRKNVLWWGYNKPTDYVQPDGSIKKIMTRWYVNLGKYKPCEFLELTKSYDSSYQHYDNFDAININNISDIPFDYKGVMGVPISFIDFYNPEQFKLIGHEHDINGRGTNVSNGQFEIEGKGVFKRILIALKEA